MAILSPIMSFENMASAILMYVRKSNVENRAPVRKSNVNNPLECDGFRHANGPLAGDRLRDIASTVMSFAIHLNAMGDHGDPST